MPTADARPRRQQLGQPGFVDRVEAADVLNGGHYSCLPVQRVSSLRSVRSFM